LVAVVLVTATLCGLFVRYLRSQLEPFIENLAVARVQYLSARLINDAVNQQITAGELDYDRMIYFEKDVSGNITALKTNMSELNRLKTEILTQINDQILSLTPSELGITLGSAVAPTLFSGMGPYLPIHVKAVSAAEATFHSAFTAAGINQTQHQLLMDVTMTIVILMPYGQTETSVSSQLVVAETVIVGSVPDNYVNFSNYDSIDDAAEDYFNVS
jgi:sporulation protein YunB